jgi:hypothetical protein
MVRVVSQTSTVTVLVLMYAAERDLLPGDHDHPGGGGPPRRRRGTASTRSCRSSKNN